MHWIRSAETAESLRIAHWQATALHYAISAHGTLIVGLRNPDRSETRFLVATMCESLKLPYRFEISKQFVVLKLGTNQTVIEDTSADVRISCSGAAVEDAENITLFYKGYDEVISLIGSFAAGNY
jgi:uncharacterized membrane protein